ncbi:Mg-chelatase subunit ChlI and Chld (MoxR-like ATPase and vWF domain) [Labilithrix luteola]|uniref:Mg-chelatase subunit ChlI and Chld (MoxR-like ATPase and vWF domain) n=1 Tax=Labilithrix luteola TaxID=1391654 RepID=A0A0K1Q802_9BACT|nr:VWA domain-containing protein [Labilithrix luteola]AKV01868.1 Mg-chelatase subunit ChlI and Chld (MoxR-like ATPase and vWF domain) [Labilithrix luteola]
MKLKTTLVLAACGVLASAAGAFAIPVSKAGPVREPWIGKDRTDLVGTTGDSARMTAGDTLLVDARLGHASLARSGSGETFLFAQVSASDDKAASAPPMHLAIVIDRSGSMKGDRIANAMSAASLAVERLRDGDSVTVVAFDTSAQVVVPPTRLGADTRGSVAAAIRSIRLGGDTCISCGLQEAMVQLGSSSLGPDRVSRMILLSDGATNVGIKDVSGLRAMARRMHDRGVTISTIGVDVDFDEKVMAAIASETNGRHHFVANASGLPQVFSQEFDDLLASVASSAELAIELAPGVEVAEVFDRTFRREGNKLIVPFGTFSAKQEKTVLVKLRVPTDHDGSQPVADVKLVYRDLVKKSDGSCGGSLALSVRDDGREQRDLDPFVAARLERSRTAQTLTEANQLFESGRIDEARAKLAARRTELKKTESSSLALAAAAPAKAPPRAKKSLDRDFDDQLGAVAAAEQNFAAPPPAAAGARPSAPAPASREGKAQVRVNQQAASDLAF